MRSLQETGFPSSLSLETQELIFGVKSGDIIKQPEQMIKKISVPLKNNVDGDYKFLIVFGFNSVQDGFVFLLTINPNDFVKIKTDEFNYSTNPTYVDTNGRILVIYETQQNVQKSFSFVTTVGLFDANDELLAVAKLSRPVEKNDEKDLTFRVRLDF